MFVLKKSDLLHLKLPTKKSHLYVNNVTLFLQSVSSLTQKMSNTNQKRIRIKICSILLYGSEAVGVFKSRCLQNGMMF